VSHDSENGKTAPGSLEESVATGGGETEDTAAVEDAATQLEALAVERDRLAAENEELQKQILRQRADYENLRRRSAKEKTEIAEYASGEAVRELLPVLDDFERALAAVPEELGSDNDYVKGVQMIQQRLQEALKKMGLEPINSVGQPFDPNFHHAVDRVQTEDAEENTILEEWQKGYNFRGRLLREAMVKVAVQPCSDE
jgi:molecular chaperone GrpE